MKTVVRCLLLLLATAPLYAAPKYYVVCSNSPSKACLQVADEVRRILATLPEFPDGWTFRLLDADQFYSFARELRIRDRWDGKALSIIPAKTTYLLWNPVKMDYQQIRHSLAHEYVHIVLKVKDETTAEAAAKELLARSK